MKTEIEVPAELLEKLQTTGHALVGIGHPKKGGLYWFNGRIFTATADFTCDMHPLLRKLPEPQQAEPWAPGVGEHVTRGGVEAVVDTDEGSDSEYPLLGRVRYGEGGWKQRTWTVNGEWVTGEVREDDLIPVPPSAPAVVSEPLLEGWVNVYRDGSVDYRKTEREANDYFRVGRIRCVHVREVR